MLELCVWIRLKRIHVEKQMFLSPVSSAHCYAAYWNPKLDSLLLVAKLSKSMFQWVVNFTSGRLYGSNIEDNVSIFCHSSHWVFIVVVHICLWVGMRESVWWKVAVLFMFGTEPPCSAETRRAEYTDWNSAFGKKLYWKALYQLDRWMTRGFN